MFPLWEATILVLRDDALHRIPSRVAAAMNILEERGISWAEYQKDMLNTVRAHWGPI